jgi:hypothetical protein
MIKAANPPVAIDADLARDLASHLIMVLRGGIPSPEAAARLLRRLDDAVNSVARR